MQKLLKLFSTSRTIHVARQVVAYHRKHPFSGCTLTINEIAMLKTAEDMVEEYDQ